MSEPVPELQELLYRQTPPVDMGVTPIPDVGVTEPVIVD